MLPGTVLFVFLAAFSFSNPVSAQDDELLETGAGKVVVVVVDALSVEHFVSEQWENLRRLTSRGGIGLMNSRTAATPFATIPAAAHVTLGAGVRAAASPTAGYAFDVDEPFQGVPAASAYAAISGLERPTAGVVALGLHPLQATALSPADTAVPGYLGQTIASRGGRVAVVGNADVAAAPLASAVTGFAGISVDPSEQIRFIPRRHGALIAMNAQGRVPLGTVGPDTLMRDSDWPFLFRTDYDAVWDAFASVYGDADLIVVELGDFARLDALAEWVSPRRLHALQRETLRRIDGWIGRLALWPPAAESLLILVSPSPPTAALRANYLLTPFAWAFVAPDAEGQPAFATSRTTRRAGIVANTDFAPFILASVGTDTDAETADGGRQPPVHPAMLPIRGASLEHMRRDLPPVVQPPRDVWRAVALLYDRATTVHRLRPPVVQTFVVSAIVTFVGLFLWFVGTKVVASAKPSPRLARFWRSVMQLLCASPLAMLFFPLFPASADSGLRVAATWLLLGGAITAAALVAGMLLDRHGTVSGRTTNPCVLISLMTAFFIVVDAWNGSPLMKSSVLGFDPIVGARYYGIGNEYMGVLVGTTLVGVTGAWDRAIAPRRPGAGLIVLLCFGLVCFTLASPRLGANVGGTVASVIGCVTTGVLLRTKRISWRNVLSSVGVAASVVAVAALVDFTRGGDTMSHLGQTVHLLRNEGWPALWAIVVRKLSMNLKLLRWTIWAQVFLVSLAVSAAVLIRPATAVRRIEARHPGLLHGVRGAVVGALAALAANDSGIVAAATMMIPVTATFLHVVLAQPPE